MSDAVIALVTSVLTLVATKLFDSFMESRKEKFQSIAQSLSAVDEISNAAADTIAFLRQDRDEWREKAITCEAQLLAKDEVIETLTRELADYNPLPNE